METGNNPITVPSSNKPRLRFGHFTLRSLLIAMALVGAWFGGRASMMPQLESERAKAGEAMRRHELAQRLQAKVRQRQSHNELVRPRVFVRYTEAPAHARIRITDGMERGLQEMSSSRRVGCSTFFLLGAGA